jgi:enamine deaminase RidA (YjgF/YER057c/UK114 family)
MLFTFTHSRFIEDSMSVYDKLKELNISLAAPATPAASYVMYAQTGNLVFLAGHISKNADGSVDKGICGRDKTTDGARQAARGVGVALLATLEQACGGNLERVTRIVKVVSLVASTPDFTEQHLVTNGCSELLGAVFGEAGRHARSAFGVPSLPLGACVEIELVAEIA